MAAGTPNNIPPRLAKLSMKGSVPTASKKTMTTISLMSSNQALSTICHDWNNSTNSTLIKPKTAADAPPVT